MRSERTYGAVTRGYLGATRGTWVGSCGVAAVVITAALALGGCSSERSAPTVDIGGPPPNEVATSGGDAVDTPDSSGAPPDSEGSDAEGSDSGVARAPRGSAAGDDPSEPAILEAPAGDGSDVVPAPAGASTIADFNQLDRSEERVPVPTALRTDPGPAGPNQRVFWIREFCGYLPAEEAALFERYPFRLVVYADGRIEYRTPQFRHFRATLTAEEKQVFHDVLRSGTLASHPNTMIPVGVTDFGTTIIGGVVDGEVRETRYSEEDVLRDPRFAAWIEGVLERALAYQPNTK